MDYKKNPDTDFKDLDKLSKDQARKQIKDLREAIEYHDHKYYVENSPVISDETYDKLFRRLQELEDEYPDLKTEDSPTQKVGGEPLDKFEKVKHQAKMYSLNAAMEEKEIDDFTERIRKKVKEIEYVLEPKFDGASIELVYKKGKLDTGSTRGDGDTGEDITENLKTIGAIPLKLMNDSEPPGLLSVRGEVFMPKDKFQELNKERIEKNKDAFANPRNAAAGVIRNLDPGKVEDKPLDVIFYQILKIEGEEFEDHWSELKEFEKWGLKVSDLNKKTGNEDDIKEYHANMSDERDDLNFEIDGVVIKINVKDNREKLGTRERSPRWAIAWKFEPKKEITTVKNIIIQVGRTGKLTPVALLEPVDVGGVTVSRATLHNEKEVRKKDIRKGDKVKLQRAGDVIPEIKERVEDDEKRKESKKFSMPDECPVCGTEIITEGEYHICPAGLYCRAQLEGHVQHFGSNEAMDIEGLGEETVKDMVEKDLIENVSDLYDLEKKDLMELEGFSDRSSENLYKAIQESKEARLDTFLYALGIRHVGKHMARVIASDFRTFEKVKNAGRQDLLNIEEVGSEIADSVSEFFDKKENIKEIEKMMDSGLKIKEMPQMKEKEEIKDKTFVFTGKMEDMTRSEAKEKVEDLGGVATSSVSGNTDYLVKGENPGSKYDDAKENDVKIIDENEFKKMIRE